MKLPLAGKGKRTAHASVEEDACRIVEEKGAGLRELTLLLIDASARKAGRAARTVAAVAEMEPQLLARVAPGLVDALFSPHRRVREAMAGALPKLARVAPARVAKQFHRLEEGFEDGDAWTQDGIVAATVEMCLASVSHQPRMAPLLLKVLAGARERTLVRWAALILPALKNEPYASARTIVAARVETSGKAEAKKLLDLLAIKPSRKRA